MEQLDIIYCKNCMHCKIINGNIFRCMKEDYRFAPDRPELYCNKDCYNKRTSKKRDKSKIHELQ